MIVLDSGISSVSIGAEGCPCICSPGGSAGGNAAGEEIGGCGAYCGCQGPSGSSDNKRANVDLASRSTDVTAV